MILKIVTNVGKDVEKLESSCIASKTIKWCNAMKTVQSFLKN